MSEKKEVLEPCPYRDIFRKLSYEEKYIHADAVGVHLFALAMRGKLKRKMLEGRDGWYDPDICSIEELKRMLIDHIDKSDMIDIANFAMMIHFRQGDE